MSKVSEISRQYHTALSASHAQYEAMYRDRVGASEGFYRDFFARLVCDFAERFRNETVIPILASHPDIRIARARQVLTIGSADLEVAQWLQVPVGAPVDSQ